MSVVVNPDGSWVLAVADGVGGVKRGEEAAPAALGALPHRISGEDEMTAAFAAANRSVRSLAPSHSLYPSDEDMPGYWGVEPVTTLAVAAWTPEDGMRAAWVGDSIPFLVPVAAGRGWHGEPVAMSGGHPVVGEFAVRGDTPAPSMLRAMRRMSDTITQDGMDRIAGDRGIIVAVLTDGAYSGCMHRTTGRWFSDNPDDNSLGFILPAGSRGSADAVADAVIACAWWHGLHDNASAAVAVMTPRTSARCR